MKKYWNVFGKDEMQFGRLSLLHNSYRRLWEEWIKSLRRYESRRSDILMVQ
jgi:hypothetical protein